MVEDDHTIDLSQLVGTWEMTRMYDGEDGTWDNEYCAEYGFVATTEFREDGTCVFSCQANGNPPSLIYATYVVEANTIVIATATSAQPVVWRIEKLAAFELNVAFDYPGENYTDRACYRRINLDPGCGAFTKAPLFYARCPDPLTPRAMAFYIPFCGFYGMGRRVASACLPVAENASCGAKSFSMSGGGKFGGLKVKKRDRGSTPRSPNVSGGSPSGVHD